MPRRLRLTGCLLGVAAFVACGGSAERSGSARDAGGDAASASGGASATGGASASGGTPTGTGGSSNTGGATPGSGGRMGTGGQGDDCPPTCFVANECVTECGQQPVYSGCCPCPPGTVNVFSCRDRDAAAPDNVSCDPKRIQCKRAPPVCQAGEVPSVDGTCYGPCVPIASCQCQGADDCPEPEQYTCHLSRQRCDYYVF